MEEKLKIIDRICFFSLKDVHDKCFFGPNPVRFTKEPENLEELHQMLIQGNIDYGDIHDDIVNNGYSQSCGAITIIPMSEAFKIQTIRECTEKLYGHEFLDMNDKYIVVSGNARVDILNQFKEDESSKEKEIPVFIDTLLSKDNSDYTEEDLYISYLDKCAKDNKSVNDLFRNHKNTENALFEYLFTKELRKSKRNK